MAACQSHRGPDYTGIYQDSYASLAHNRLSILDLSEQGNQPMMHGPFIIIYNGEVYNFAEIKHELLGLGYTFTSTSDTEVILKAFAQWGTDSFIRFNGIFFHLYL
jgi:asparagine synthase (glutamine-hydrolysing)